MCIHTTTVSGTLPFHYLYVYLYFFNLKNYFKLTLMSQSFFFFFSCFFTTMAHGRSLFWDRDLPLSTSFCLSWNQEYRPTKIEHLEWFFSHWSHCLGLWWFFTSWKPTWSVTEPTIFVGDWLKNTPISEFDNDGATWQQSIKDFKTI